MRGSERRRGDGRATVRCSDAGGAPGAHAAASGPVSAASTVAPNRCGVAP